MRFSKVVGLQVIKIEICALREVLSSDGDEHIQTRKGVLPIVSRSLNGIDQACFGHIRPKTAAVSQQRPQ